VKGSNEHSKTTKEMVRGRQEYTEHGYSMRRPTTRMPDDSTMLLRGGAGALSLGISRYYHNNTCSVINPNQYCVHSSQQQERVHHCDTSADSPLPVTKGNMYFQLPYPCVTIRSTHLFLSVQTFFYLLGAGRLT
jgi:hypothetical protein